MVKNLSQIGLQGYLIERVGLSIRRGDNAMSTIDYRQRLLEDLKDIDEAAAYLTECFNDSEEVFLLGLRDVVEARGGVGKLAKLTGLNREGLYKILSENGNPRLSSIAQIFRCLGINIHFTGDDEEHDEAA